jgi:sugar fermentation stimulation protein A
MQGETVWAHLPNSGRLTELLVPGRRALLRDRSGPAGRRPARKTNYDLSFVELDGRWVSVDARLPNDLVAEALVEQRLEPLLGYSSIRREVVFGQSRFDFLLEAPQRQPCWVEAKSVTLVLDGLACFPDAVTRRGRRHLLELAAARREGHRAVVLFVVQRDDAVGMRPHDESDPDFGQALRSAAREGVEIYAYGCCVEPQMLKIAESLPVYLEAAQEKGGECRMEG